MSASQYSLLSGPLLIDALLSALLILYSREKDFELQNLKKFAT